jgi:hypothetical protein
MNMPMLIAVNPTHLLAPTELARVRGKVMIGILAPRVLHRAARRQNALLDANASSDQHQIERRERRRDHDGAKSEGQDGDLDDDQQIIRVS